MGKTIAETWAAEGQRDARKEASEGYPAAQFRRVLKPFVENEYDEAHAEYFRRRAEAIAAYLDAYYDEWRAEQDRRYAARSTEV